MLQVLHGGLMDSALTSEKVFVQAEITDTRLMGVVAIHAIWKLPQNSLMTNLHQFFYFDAEEYGFDTYESVLGCGDDEEYAQVDLLFSKIIGGLGGKMVHISEKELRYMVQQYTRLSLNAGLELPEKLEEYEFLMAPVVELDDQEEFALMYKQCPVIETPYQVINYFIMRCVGRDFGAAKFLTKNYVRTDLYSEHKAASLLRNSIEKADDALTGTNTGFYATSEGDHFTTFQTRQVYRCESLIEYDGKYFMLVSLVHLDRLKVVKYERVSSFRISQREVAMLTSQQEYVSVYDFMGAGEEFEERSTALTKNAMTFNHETGRLFMVFYSNNDHVNRQVFNLNGDVMGLYYVMDNGQIILAAYNRKNIQLLEADLKNSRYGNLVVPGSRYKLTEPAIYDFISNGFEDFDEFIEMIANGFHDDDGE